MQPTEFLFEEYKQIHLEVRVYQEGYFRIENATLAGVVLIYGFLFTAKTGVPEPLWWMIAAFLLIPAARCMAYYYVIAFVCVPHMERLETALYDGKFIGYQNRVSKYGRRWMNLAFNLAAWIVVIGTAIVMAIFHTKFLGK